MTQFCIWARDSPSSILLSLQQQRIYHFNDICLALIRNEALLNYFARSYPFGAGRQVTQVRRYHFPPGNTLWGH